jgi:hypothetical protein
MRLEDIAIGGEDEVILEALADFMVASGRYDGKARGRLSVDGDVEIHRQGSGIKGRTQVGGRGWKGKVQRGLAAARLFTLLLILRHSGALSQISLLAPEFS